MYSLACWSPSSALTSSGPRQQKSSFLHSCVVSCFFSPLSSTKHVIAQPSELLLAGDDLLTFYFKISTTHAAKDRSERSYSRFVRLCDLRARLGGHGHLRPRLLHSHHAARIRLLLLADHSRCSAVLAFRRRRHQRTSTSDQLRGERAHPGDIQFIELLPREEAWIGADKTTTFCILTSDLRRRSISAAGYSQVYGYDSIQQ